MRSVRGGLVKASTARLFSMLPRVLVVRALAQPNGVLIGIHDMTDGAGKRDHGLDHNYPGFLECLVRLVSSGHVIDAGACATGRKGDAIVVERIFVSLHPSSPSPKGPST